MQDRTMTDRNEINWKTKDVTLSNTLTLQQIEIEASYVLISWINISYVSNHFDVVCSVV